MLDETLLPPLPAIHAELTRNRREHRRLHTLLKLALEERDDRERSRERTTKPPEPAASGGEVAS
jgi:hypothetical protein